MIFDTNRTKSLIEESVETDEMEVEVNENYFGAGSLMFMQEAAEDEMALFEEAVKSDLDEVVIGEAAEELKALNEGFAEKTVNKIQELMKKFIEWLKGIYNSAIMKFNQYLVKDNAKFCAEAKKRLPNVEEGFKFTGKALKSTKFESVEDLDKAFDQLDALWGKVSGGSANAETVKNELDEILKKVAEAKKAKNFEAVNVYTEENGTLKVVEDHLEYLEKVSKEKVKELMKKCKEYQAKANKVAKEAKTAARKAKDETEEKRNQLAAASQVAAAIKKVAQETISEEMKAIRKMVAISRSVVAKALAKVPATKNEGVELDEAFINAMLESEEYELESALEEMSEAAECEDCGEDDIAEEE